MERLACNSGSSGSDERDGARRLDEQSQAGGPSNMKVMRRKLMSESDLYRLTPNRVHGRTMGTVITNRAQ